MFEFVLIIIGLVIIAASYLLSEKITGEKKLDFNVISNEDLRKKMEVATESIVDDTLEKVEIRLEKLSNEKIMAVSEYSDTVITDINKSHNEVMFLYSMLNEKEKEIKETAREVNIARLNKGNIEDLSAQTQSQNHISEVKPEEKTLLYSGIVLEETSHQNPAQNDLILDLHKQGYGIMDIAKQLGLGVGEVRLVIDLYRPH